ncbi:hypothetical protein DFJ74DRAFT_488055 [Hyaloraphidium curvatum]|nr:hypothetical protein DFJ74DRAFT_488055 [Hyaloraphidium curvatum]
MTEEAKADFRPAEWLALFPAPAPPLRSFGNVSPAFPDDAPRAADPLTRDGILRDVDGAAWLAAWPALRLHAALPGWHAAALFAVAGAAAVALLGIVVPISGARFAAKDIGIGLAAVVFVYVANVIMFAAYGPTNGSNLLRKGLLEFSPLGAVCRWLRLVRAADADNPSKGSLDTLVDHVPGDEDCACASCCGWLEKSGGVLSLVDVLVNVVMTWALCLFTVYTPLVSYGGAIWSSPYGGLLGSLCILAWGSALLSQMGARPLLVANVAYTTLERRLHCRAVAVAMADLLGRFHAAAGDGEEPPRLRSWLYVRLHYRFAAMCRFRRQQDMLVVSRLYGMMELPGVLVFTALYAAVGRCISAWQLAYLVHAVVYFIINTINLASRNALIDAVAGVYTDAQRELRALSLSAGPGPLAAELALHDATISSFLDVSRHRARLFGFVVSFGTARTMLVTLLTVCVALWTVLRAFGVGVTLESFCPSQP